MASIRKKLNSVARKLVGLEKKITLPNDANYVCIQGDPEAKSNHIFMAPKSVNLTYLSTKLLSLAPIQPQLSRNFCFFLAWSI